MPASPFNLGWNHDHSPKKQPGSKVPDSETQYTSEQLDFLAQAKEQLKTPWWKNFSRSEVRLSLGAITISGLLSAGIIADSFARSFSGQPGALSEAQVEAMSCSAITQATKSGNISTYFTDNAERLGSYARAVGDLKVSCTDRQIGNSIVSLNWDILHENTNGSITPNWVDLDSGYVFYYLNLPSNLPGQATSPQS